MFRPLLIVLLLSGCASVTTNVVSDGTPTRVTLDGACPEMHVLYTCTMGEGALHIISVAPGYNGAMGPYPPLKLILQTGSLLVTKFYIPDAQGPLEIDATSCADCTVRLDSAYVSSSYDASRDWTSATPEDEGIYIRASTSTTVHLNFTTLGAFAQAVLVEGGRDVTVEKLILLGCDHGVEVRGSKQLTILDTHAFGCRGNAFHINDVQVWELSSSSVEETATGILVDGRDDQVGSIQNFKTLSGTQADLDLRAGVISITDSRFSNTAGRPTDAGCPGGAICVGASATVEVHASRFIATAPFALHAAAIVDATDNYWGGPVGPSPDAIPPEASNRLNVGGKVTPNVQYVPYRQT
ncbi:MAG: right-handed parallel beta-helix repeat-containing protein [Candidatus Thermoplasmatota archaeon]